MRIFIVFYIVLMLGALSCTGQETRPKIGQMELAPGAGYIPYTDASGSQKYELLDTLVPANTNIYNSDGTISVTRNVGVDSTLLFNGINSRWGLNSTLINTWSTEPAVGFQLNSPTIRNNAKAGFFAYEHPIWGANARMHATQPNSPLDFNSIISVSTQAIALFSGRGYSSFQPLETQNYAQIYLGEVGEIYIRARRSNVMVGLTINGTSGIRAYQNTTSNYIQYPHLRPSEASYWVTQSNGTAAWEPVPSLDPNNIYINDGSLTGTRKMTMDSYSLEMSGGAIFSQGSMGDNPYIQDTTMLAWIPSKAAFRAGGSDEGSWADTLVGEFSTAFGFGAVASGYSSFAQGMDTKPFSSRATGYNSVAFTSGHAFGIRSFCLGVNNIAYGGGSVSFWGNAYATNSVTFNSGITDTLATQSFAAISGTTYGQASLAIGSGTRANTANEFAIGRFNRVISGSISVPNDAQPAFVVGNGNSPAGRKDALRLYKSGRLYINPGIDDTYITETLRVGGDVRIDNLSEVGTKLVTADTSGILGSIELGEGLTINESGELITDVGTFYTENDTITDAVRTVTLNEELIFSGGDHVEFDTKVKVSAYSTGSPVSFITVDSVDVVTRADIDQIDFKIVDESLKIRPNWGRSRWQFTEFLNDPDNPVYPFPNITPINDGLNPSIAGASTTDFGAWNITSQNADTLDGCIIHSESNIVPNNGMTFFARFRVSNPSVHKAYLGFFDDISTGINPFLGIYGVVESNIFYFQTLDAGGESSLSTTLSGSVWYNLKITVNSDEDAICEIFTDDGTVLLQKSFDEWIPYYYGLRSGVRYQRKAILSGTGTLTLEYMGVGPEDPGYWD